MTRRISHRMNCTGSGMRRHPLRGCRPTTAPYGFSEILIVISEKSTSPTPLLQFKEKKPSSVLIRIPEFPVHAQTASSTAHTFHTLNSDGALAITTPLTMGGHVEAHKTMSLLFSSLMQIRPFLTLSLKPCRGKGLKSRISNEKTLPSTTGCANIWETLQPACSISPVLAFIKRLESVSFIISIQDDGKGLLPHDPAANAEQIPCRHL